MPAAPPAGPMPAAELLLLPPPLPATDDGPVIEDVSANFAKGINDLT